jgi:hypothetical protein
MRTSRLLPAAFQWLSTPPEHLFQGACGPGDAAYYTANLGAETAIIRGMDATREDRSLPSGTE